MWVEIFDQIIKHLQTEHIFVSVLFIFTNVSLVFLARV